AATKTAPPARARWSARAEAARSTATTRGPAASRNAPGRARSLATGRRAARAPGPAAPSRRERPAECAGFERRPRADRKRFVARAMSERRARVDRDAERARSFGEHGLDRDAVG